MTVALFSVLLGYLIGSMPTGYLVARAKGVDIRTTGSGNIGATNVMRSLGFWLALMVLAIDLLKGAAAVLIAMALGVGEWGVALTALAAVLGNDFNPFLRFQGGKGIAVSLGAFFPINPAVSLVALAIALFVIAVSRYVSLGALTGIVSAPLILLVGAWSPASLMLLLALALLAVIQHRANLIRLAQGNERRLGEKRNA